MGPGTHDTFGAPSETGVSVSPSPVIKTHWPSKPNALGGSSSRYQPPKLVSLTQGSLTSVRELVPCNYSVVCGSPTQEGMGLFFYIMSRPSYHLVIPSLFLVVIYLW